MKRASAAASCRCCGAADARARLLAHLVEAREAAPEVEAPRLLLLADEQGRAREVDLLVRLQDLRRETAPRLDGRKFVSRSHKGTRKSER